MREYGSSLPTAVELDVLRLLWKAGPSRLQALHATVGSTKRVYSSTLSLVRVMLRKGLVKRIDTRWPHRYVATMSRDQVGKALLRQLIHKVYDGSAGSLVLDALAGHKPSREDIGKIRKRLDEFGSLMTVEER